MNVNGSWVNTLKVGVILNKETSIKNKSEKKTTKLTTYTYIFKKINKNNQDFNSIVEKNSEKVYNIKKIHE